MRAGLRAQEAAGDRRLAPSELAADLISGRSLWPRLRRRSRLRLGGGATAAIPAVPTAAATSTCGRGWVQTAP
eukprot:CAMPEP_0171142236 /NCGR_PEP_ID=MMETSP0766_2-20121228/142084_1 /TAXON_ID=439317 /ORGANISM="Gambierdiscus australes, Strain CAWD 149" /LENGTH=72 /DNA_ID=CAMNT_0011606015 /DNA_START=114 /DNA_END=328 /DNA_ORIENTATION=+